MFEMRINTAGGAKNARVKRQDCRMVCTRQDTAIAIMNPQKLQLLAIDLQDLGPFIRGGRDLIRLYTLLLN